MKIKVESCPGAKVLVLTGRLDTSTAPEAQKCFEELLEAGNSRLLADCTELDFVSSAGLRVLLLVSKRLKSTGGSFGLFGTNAAVREVLEISGFTAILRVFQERREALDAI